MESSINVEEIEVLFAMIVKKLRSDKLDKFNFNIDQYWIILSNEWSVLKDPTAPAVGSLDEDTLYLKKAIDEGEIYSYSNLDRMAAILRAISELQAPS